MISEYFIVCLDAKELLQRQKLGLNLDIQTAIKLKTEFEKGKINIKLSCVYKI